MGKEVDLYPYLHKSPVAIETTDKELQDAYRSFSRFAFNSVDKYSGVLYRKMLAYIERKVGTSMIIRTSNLPRAYHNVLTYLREQKLIQDIGQLPLYTDEPRMFYYYLVAPFDVESTDGYAQLGVYAFGVSSHDSSIALSKAVGEFLERYPLLVYREKDLYKASVSHMQTQKKSFLHPDVLCQFSDDQKNKYNEYDYTENDLFYWIRGTSALTQENVYLPAQTVFSRYCLGHTDFLEKKIREINTNGAAAHFTQEEALLSGIYEIIQRDGFLIYWLYHRAPPRIDINSVVSSTWCPASLRTLIAQCVNARLEIYFLDVTMPDTRVPSCICVVVDHSPIGVKMSIAGGCDSDWYKALERSLEEALLVLHLSRTRKDDGVVFPSIDKKNYTPFDDATMDSLKRINLFANPAMFDTFKFFLEGELRVFCEESDYYPLGKFISPADELREVTDIFRKIGEDAYDILYYKAKHRVLDTLGFHSVKVVIPGLMHLYLREVHAGIGAPRLLMMAKKLGFNPDGKLNPFPHPFP